MKSYYKGCADVDFFVMIVNWDMTLSESLFVGSSWIHWLDDGEHQKGETTMCPRWLEGV